MNFTIKELNELIYSLGITATNGRLCDKQLNASLLDRLQDELCSRILSEAKEEVDADFNDNLPNFKYIPPAPKKLGEGTAQMVLDYVDTKGAVTHKEMHEYYKSLNGSNTFSWCLRNLRIPYKNRPTRRYLVKEGKKGSNAKWVVKVANPSNWVVKDYDYTTFNEAPYGE
jgi:hypothetical protein